MTLNFKDDSEVIIYALEKIISFAKQNQYFFVASCAWWIASVIGLDTGLTTHIDNLVRAEGCRGISTTPRDIARDISVDPITREAIAPEKYITDPLRRTRKGRINPLPQTKKQLRKARQKPILSKKQQNRLRAIDTDTLTEYLSKRK